MQLVNDFMAAAMMETLRTAIPEDERNPLVDALFERAKEALVAHAALQNEVARLLQENEQLRRKLEGAGKV